MRKVRENILVADGNLPLFPADQAVFSCPAGDRTGLTINVLPGQVVVYDPVTQISLGPTADLTTNDRIVVAVGVDTDGDGASNELRKAYGEQIYGQFINVANAEPPRCGTPEIVDVLYRCTDIGETYAVQISVEDDSSQNQYPYNRPATYLLEAVTQAGACDDCSSEVFAGEVACKLVDSAKGHTYGLNPTQISTFKRPVDQKLPFTVHRLFSRSLVYCLSPIANECNGCTDIAAITGVTIEETDGSGGVDTTFTNSVNPLDSSKTLQAQLSNIVAQINTALNGLGSASITGGVGECCPIQLEVNTCSFEFTLFDEGDVEIEPCSEVNPLAPVTVANSCRNCGGASSADITYDGGIRIIANAVDIKCDCAFPANPPIGFFGRKLNAHPSGGFQNGATFVRKTQALTLPTNLGYQWQWREYASDNGGMGRGHNPYNDNHGPIGLPLANDRARSTKVDCKTNYCSYTLEHGLPHTNNGVSAPFRLARGRTVLLIPSGDATTRTEWEALINNYITNSPSLPIKSVMTCSSDQDQDAEFASGVLTMSDVVGDGETVTIGGVTYTFNTTLTDSANNVLIGANQTASMLNLSRAIIGGVGEGTLYGTGTVAHTEVTAAPSAATLTVTALNAGTAGNTIATTDTLTDGDFADTTLTGGTNSAIASNPYPNANGYIV